MQGIRTSWKYLESWKAGDTVGLSAEKMVWDKKR